jgi:SAM-dependent methyltransferase
MKLNLGCGFRHLPGYINVDRFADARPDVLHDLEQAPWPFETDSVDEIVARHVLEHLGATFDRFAVVFREIYRVCRNQAQVKIAVPHHLHGTFVADPTHVRPYTTLTFQMMSQALNRQWIDRDESYTMLARMLGVDFELAGSSQIFDPWWRARVERGEMTQEDLQDAATSRVGVVSEIRVILRVIKPLRADPADWRDRANTPR